MTDVPLSSVDDDRIREEAAGWVVKIAGDPDARAGLDHWLEADPRHAEIYQRVAHRFDGARVLRTSARYPRDSKSIGPKVIVALSTLAAAAAAAIVFFSPVLRNSAQEAAGRHRPVVAALKSSALDLSAQLNSHLGEIRSVQLPDGSTVTLDTASTLKVDFGANDRKLTLLRGRARFIVAHEKRPFIVLAGGGSVTARGTIFDVALEKSGKVRVHLLRGIVDVDTPAPTGPSSNKKQLTPGEQAEFKRGQPIVLDVRPITEQASWPDGFVDVQAVSLASLIDQANRYTDRPIIVDDPAIGKLQVSGRFRINDPNQLALNLAKLFDLRAAAGSNAIVLRRE